MNEVQSAVALLAVVTLSVADLPVRAGTAGSFQDALYTLPALLARVACPGMLKAPQLSDADLYLF